MGTFGNNFHDVEQKKLENTFENQTNFCFTKSENSFQSTRQVGRNRLKLRLESVNYNNTSKIYL